MSVFRQQHTLATASRYASPRDGNAILPIVYGVNLGSGTGRWVCPCINTATYQYLYSDSPVLSVANGNTVRVYKDGVLQTSGYTFTASGTDANGKTIAYITFAANPGDSAVISAQGSGKINGSGTLIQHPLDILADIITYAGGSTSAFDATAWAQEYQYASAEGLLGAGVLTHGSRLVQELMLEVLSSFFCTSWVGPSGTLKLQFPRYSVTQDNVVIYLREAECFDHSAVRLRATLCNTAIWNIGKNTMTQQAITPNATFADANPALPAASINRYGVFKKVFDAAWSLSAAVCAKTQRAIYYQYASPRWIVTLTTSDPRVIQVVERGDLVCFSWEKLRDENLLPLVNQIGQVLEIRRNVLQRTATLKIRDTGAYYTGSGTTRDRTRY